jgi:hypothetical protein
MCCEGQALHFGNINDPKSEMARWIAEPGLFQLNPRPKPPFGFIGLRKPRPL